MDFRYKLAKETFKGKKVPAKKSGEEHVCADQRGDETYVGAPKKNPSLLSLGKNAVIAEETPTAKSDALPTEDLSRRGFFGMFTRYADGVVAQDRQRAEALKKKTRKIKKRKTAAPATEEAATVVTPTEAPPVAAPVEQPGFFRRLWQKIKNLFRRYWRRADAVAATHATGETSLPSASPFYNEGFTGSAPVVASDEAEVFATPLIEDDEPEKEMSRRGLLRQGIHFFAKPAIDSVQSKIDSVNEVVSKITRRIPLLRPPGAISERDFLQVCTRCDKCIHACPKDAILKAPKTFGMLVIGSPYIDPIKNPCVMCDGLPCIPACPEGALLPVASPADVRMGYAILDQGRCQAYGENSFCQQCVIDCPIPGAITQKDNKPIIHKNICTGCGVCVNSCNTVNIPVAIKIKPQMVIESQLRQRELEKFQTETQARERAQRAIDAKENSAPVNAELDAEKDA
jgi:ferredoxin-type protein NapG